MSGHESINVRKGGSHPLGERLVVRISLERIHPDDRVRRPLQARHLPRDECRILALPAVGHDHDGRATRECAPPPDVVERPERGADPRARRPVDDSPGRRRKRLFGVTSPELLRQPERAASRTRTPRRRAPTRLRRAETAAARACTPPSTPRRRRAERACAALRCGAGTFARSDRPPRASERRAMRSQVEPPAARVRTQSPRPSQRTRSRHLRHRLGEVRELLGRHRGKVLPPQHLVDAPADLSRLLSGTVVVAAPVGTRALREPRRLLDRTRTAIRRSRGRTQEPRGERAVEAFELLGPRDERRAQRPVDVLAVADVDAVEPG